MKTCLSLCLLLLVVGPKYSIGQEDINYNLDLEKVNSETKLPIGWGFGNISKATLPNDSSSAAYLLDNVNKKQGDYSLLIDWSKPYAEWTATNYVIHKTFKGKKIKLTGYLKTEGITKGAGLWMRIDGDGKVLAFDNMSSRFVTGTTDWEKYSIELEYDADQAEQIVVGGIVVGQGKLWMDDLQISVGGKDISKAEKYVKKIEFKAEADTAFNTSSGIATITCDKDKLSTLTNLGMLWGFLKYYHANVCRGDYNMDAELFRVLPKVLAAKNKKETNTILASWVDGFGKPDICKSCDTFVMTDDVKLAPDYGYIFDKGNLSAELVDRLHYIKRNRQNSESSYYIEMHKRVGNPNFLHELSYSTNKYPDAGIRLLSLYRYWNMIQYFFPNRHLIGEDWNKVLTDCIPEFCNAKDETEYQLACLKLIGRIHDTHANLWQGANSLGELKGIRIASCKAMFIEQKLVVVDYYSDDSDIREKVKIGDIIEKIGDDRVDDLVEKYLPLTPASNLETQLRDMRGVRGFLLRTNKESIKLTINRGGDVSAMEIETVPLSMTVAKLDRGKMPESSFRMLDDNIGYIYPALLKSDDFKKIKHQFADTRGIVIDMRCYPSDFMTFTYGSWLKPRSSPFVVFTGGSADMPGKFEYSKPQSNGGGPVKHYKGKVVIIVNESTQSSAEFQTMALATAENVTVIGSITAGADGNVSQLTLPGGLSSMISGIGILYPDGTETQRVGIKIDKEVKPTIKGIIDGRDEPMEEALRIINEGR